MYIFYAPNRYYVMSIKTVICICACAKGPTDAHAHTTDDDAIVQIIGATINFMRYRSSLESLRATL